MQTSPTPPNESVSKDMVTTATPDREKEDGDMLAAPLEVSQQGQELRKVRASVPLTVWTVAAVSTCERFAFYGMIGPFQNYIQNSRHDPLRPGALGLGEETASLIVNIFYLISYATPMVAACVADTYFGRYKTILGSYGMYVTGVVVLFVTSLPPLLNRGAGLPGLIVAIIVISLGSGGIRSSLPPFLAEQCTSIEDKVRTTKTGERVLVSRDATVEYVFNIYYWGSNIGAQSRLAATFIEKDCGFWAAFLMSLGSISLGLFLLMLNGKKLIDRKPSGSILPPAGRAFAVAIKNKWAMDAARPAAVLEREGIVVSWTDKFIDQLQAGLLACRAFIPYILYWLCQAQMTTNTVSQAAQMETHGVPNDLLPNINSITVIIFLPLTMHFLYPFLRRHHIPMAPIARMTTGFFFESLGMAWAAGVQGWIYASPPCYAHPRACPASRGGALPNAVNVGVQAPVYFFEGVGEIFASPAAYEYAFTKAPKSMKSIIQAIYALCAAAGSVIGLALNPTYKDPHLLGMYAGLAGAMFVAMVIHFMIFFEYDQREEELNRVGRDED